MNWTPDDSQRQVIKANGGYHLVLASPGCGKTQILTERIREAQAAGVSYDDMLCLTFTNRAARGMMERVRANIADEDVSRVYVGNVHRFCSKFLFESGIVPAVSSIIDDDDAISIISRYLDEDEHKVKENYNRKKAYSEVVFFSHLMRQIEGGHPKRLRIHPDCMTANDIAAIRKICAVQRMEFCAKSMIDIYEHIDFYREAANNDGYDYGTRHVVIETLRKMDVSWQYEKYKSDNSLLDYEDLLLLAYDTLKADTRGEYKRYTWIQVDEVQDLNPLQLAIIDALTAPKFLTVMYLGDEQQAIFSFMGAKMDTLDVLKRRCEGNIHHLNVNHRSPKYLLDVFNEYADKVLNIDADLLPRTVDTDELGGERLQVLASNTINTEYKDISRFVEGLYKNSGTDTTAVIVNSNFDADKVSEALRERALPHFKVSGDDLFSSDDVKLLLAHFSVIDNEHNFIAWARLFKGLGVFNSNAAARNFTRQLLDRAILPTDLLLYKGETTYTIDFMDTWEQDEIVVFDTETTGLDVFEDDILQIAAVKVRHGQVVTGSEFNIFIATNRHVPTKLGDIDNPVINEMSQNTLYEHGVALRKFMGYVGDGVLLGHNADYDYNILDNNLRRYLPSENLREHHPKYFDTLKLIRLLEPGLKEYKLKYLLATLRLAGENAHLADADVNATVSLMNYCHGKCVGLLGSQAEFLRRATTRKYAETLIHNYKEVYSHTIQMLYKRDLNAVKPALVAEMRHVYDEFVALGSVKTVEKMDYIYRYLTEDTLSQDIGRSLKEQLSGHIVEINTLKEADLCGGSTMADRMFVTTVHKAKGLEFDNVVIFDAVDGRYPNYFNASNPRQKAEDARKFYVAMSRAKRRLYVAYSMTRVDYHNQPQPRELTPFMLPILRYFN